MTNNNHHREEWRSLLLFSIYRLIVIIAFIFATLVEIPPTFLGKFNLSLFLVTTWLYLIFTIATFITIQKKYPTFAIQIFVQFFIDIIAITILMYASGGLNSGLGALLLISVAGFSLLTEGRTAFFFAAMASLAVLLQAVFADIYRIFLNTSYTHAGMLGLSFFATAFLAHSLAKRAKKAHEIADDAVALAKDLSKLNAEIVGQIQSGIVVIDMVGRIHLVNKTAQYLLDLGEKSIGRSIYSVIPDFTNKLIQWKHSGKSPKKSFHLSFNTTRKTELLLNLKEIGQGVQKSEQVSILLTIVDAELIAKRAQELKLASMGRLTASIAHEIRGPLHAIKQATQLLEESLNLPEDSPDTKLLNTMLRQSKLVNTIINKVSQLGQPNQLISSDFDLEQWLENFIEEFKLQRNLSEIDIQVDIKAKNLMITFDPIHLYQILVNLCDNGLRYSEKNPLLYITIGIDELTQQVYLEVCDKGEGISDENITHIFEPFFTTGHNGSGLGLYISREMCEINQASLSISKNDSTGCCFRIDFVRHLVEIE